MTAAQNQFLSVNDLLGHTATVCIVAAFFFKVDNPARSEVASVNLQALSQFD
jgi:hypothetical protein